MTYFVNYLLVFSLGIFGACLTSCEKERQEAVENIRPVRYTRVQSRSPSLLRTFSGVAQAGAESKLSFKVNGTVNQVSVKVGDKIPRGGVIATMDPTDFNLQLQQTQASLDRAQAEERNAAAVYERTRLLYENNNASRSELDATRAAYESTKAAALSIKKQIQMSRQQLKYTELKAPITCSIAAVDIEENENVRSGQLVVVANCGTQAEVDVGVPESVISLIKQGSLAQVTFDAFTAKTFEAVVTEVGVAVTSASSTFPVTVQLTEPNPLVRSGMTADVTFSLESEETQKRIFLEPIAVKEDLKGQFVFIVEPEGEDLGIARKRFVKPGELMQDGLEIIEGLKDGDLVVTAGASRLQDGLKVRLLKSMEK